MVSLKELEENKERLARIDTVMNAATRPGKTLGDALNGIAQYERERASLIAGKPIKGETILYLGNHCCSFSKGRNSAASCLLRNPSLPGLKSEDTIVVEQEGNRFLTYTGKWTYMDIEHEGNIYRRPDILVRDE
ncbi:hypothetical protein ACEQPO_28345 [Bacillus sp. SL00103]